MRVYLVRHAEANGATGVWLLDEFRSLTPRGRRRFKRTARAFARKRLHIELLCTSPALRAVQTAELLSARAGGPRAARECYVLRPFRKGAGMQVYIVRHGIAEDGGEGMPDGSRALTSKGRRRFQKTARAFARLGHELDLILTSPLVRAVQTAEILAGAADHREVAVLEELDPKFDVEALRTAAAKRAGKAGAIALVGHEPQLSATLAALCGVKASDLDLKKGSIVRLDVTRLDGDQPADGRWWLKPRSGSRAKGLPFSRDALHRLREDGRRAAAPKRKRAASKRARATGRRGSRPRAVPAEPSATA